MAKITLTEYLKQFYKPFLFFLAATLFIYIAGSKAELTGSILANAFLKIIFTLTAFAVYILAFDKKAVYEAFSIIILEIKRK